VLGLGSCWVWGVALLIGVLSWSGAVVRALGPHARTNWKRGHSSWSRNGQEGWFRHCFDITSTTKKRYHKWTCICNRDRDPGSFWAKPLLCTIDLELKLESVALKLKRYDANTSTMVKKLVW